MVISKYSQEFAHELVLDVCVEFKKLIPDTPYTGGDTNPFTGNLLFSAQLLPLFKVVRQKEINKDEGGALSLKLKQVFAECVRNGLRIAEIPITYRPRADRPKLSSLGDGVKIGLFCASDVFSGHNRTAGTLATSSTKAMKCEIHETS